MRQMSFALYLLLFFFVCALPLRQASSSDYFAVRRARLAFEADPLGALMSFNSDGFYAQGAERKETVTGQGSYFPSIRIGLGLDAARSSFELTAGGGYILNNAFTAPLISADFLAGFALADDVAFGPRFGAFYSPSPEWKGKESDIALDGAAGFRGGVVLSFARLRESWSLLLSADYLFLQYDAKPSDAWAPSDDKFDVSGLAVQIGLVYRPQEHTRAPRSAPPIIPAPTTPAILPKSIAPASPVQIPSTLEPLHNAVPAAPERPSTPAPQPKPEPAPKAAPQPELPVAPSQQPAAAPVVAPEKEQAPAAADQPATNDDPGPDDGADVAP